MGVKRYRKGRVGVSDGWRKTVSVIKTITKSELGLTQEKLWERIKYCYPCALATFIEYLKPRREPPGLDKFFKCLAGAFADVNSLPEKDRDRYLIRLERTYRGKGLGLGNLTVERSTIAGTLEVIRQTQEKINSKLADIETHMRYFAFDNILKVDSRFDWVPDTRLDDFKTTDIVMLGRMFLFGQNDQYSAVTGMGPPFYAREKIHPGVRDQLNSITRRLNLDENVRKVKSLNVRRIKGDWISLSGPVNNLFARNLLGTGADSPLLGLVAKSANDAKPPVRFDIAKHLGRIARGEPLLRDWELIVRTGDSETRIGNGEYMLITSVPDPYQSGARAVNLASMFPPGAMSVDLILRDWRLMERILNGTKAYAGWQALIPIRVVNQQPVALEEAKLFEIPVDFEQLREVLSKKPHEQERKVEGTTVRLARQKSSQ